MTISFSDIVPSPDMLMGVKAVYGSLTSSSEAIMGFATRGTRSQPRAYYSAARLAAEKSQTQPFLISIGASQSPNPEMVGRVLELSKVSSVFGETAAFVQDQAIRAALARWQIAVYLTEVYEIINYPKLQDDLGFPDRSILTNAYDKVVRPEQINRLYDALKDWPVRFRTEVRYLSDIDLSAFGPFASRYPMIQVRESDPFLVVSTERTRDPGLARIVKDNNRRANGGLYVCEACDFSDSESALFDAHHLNPIAEGLRLSGPEDLVVLCALCHRWAHFKAADVQKPIPLEQLKIMRGPTVTTNQHNATRRA